MGETRLDSIQSIRRPTPDWILTGLRLVLVALLAKPAASKFVTYGTSVSFFDAFGIPAPAVMVVIAGLIEVGAVALLLLGVGERLAALSLVPVMLVAILYVGVDWKNLVVLVGSLAILVSETGSVSFRRPVERLLG